MVERKRIQGAKKVSIIEYLSALGEKPMMDSDILLFYSINFTKDGNKSFYVNSINNTFKTEPNGEEKDIISFIREMFDLNFYEAIEQLEAFKEKKTENNNLSY